MNDMTPQILSLTHGAYEYGVALRDIDAWLNCRPLLGVMREIRCQIFVELLVR